MRRLSSTVCPPRYAYVVFVANYEPGNSNADTMPESTFHNLDMSKPPFGLNVSNALLFAQGKRGTLDRVVQVYDTSAGCS